ncbi:hypothetical protein ABH940_004514 [Streptacidiphilus sp. BW17]|uniref:RloB family protein n=1 Tax=Streptacidiphilus sp. BW17 TaxID=3156274 RepID=UPI003513CA6B
MLLLVCGAKVTERNYFNGLRDAFRSSNVRIKVVTEPKSPVQVVEKAAEIFEDERDSFDECWAVFDVDEFDMTAAVALAGKRNVRLAISNPCFEFWLLLHFCNYSGSLADFRAVLGKLKKYCPRYDKSRIRFSDYVQGVLGAIDRARVIDEKSEELIPNPSSGVWRIAEQMVPPGQN